MSYPEEEEIFLEIFENRILRDTNTINITLRFTDGKMILEKFWLNETFLHIFFWIFFLETSNGKSNDFSLKINLELLVCKSIILNSSWLLVNHGRKSDMPNPASITGCYS
ncbi:UNVERIFIED_CONTAM: hypothetical protein NCL1_47830 [Trichonephila clavipes]